ncbi:hypothetical protein KJ359_006658 [Pestalotiopsis sp. 9143b]|nr:hypothetical protein KJ359_006658 [Pestalotiopsis sp. 9143b]
MWTLRKDQNRERVVWIDAICINQADLEERSEQVKHMRSIYQNASSVHISLGDPYDGIETALEYLALSAEDASRHFEPGHDNHLSVRDLDANSNELAISIVRLFYLPWWRRLWTVQEYLLAGEVQIFCGKHLISSGMLKRAAKNLIRHGQSCCDPDAGSFQTRFFVHANKDESHNVWHGCNNLLSLDLSPDFTLQPFHRTMAIFRMRQSTDPRDKIYGLLGLAPKALDGLVPLDYTSPVEDLFEAFTVAYIRRYKNLGILGAIGGTRQLPNLASFCPDWTSVPDQTSRNDEAMFIQMNNRMIVQELYLDPHFVTEATWSQTERGAVAVNGFVFDVIQEVSLECFRQSWEIRRPWAESLQTLAGQADILTLLRALCGDLVRDRDTNSFSLIEDNDKAIEDQLQKWWEWTLSDGVTGPTRDGDISRVENAVLQTCSGDAYIHGIMRGDAFRLAERQAGEFDELTLV